MAFLPSESPSLRAERSNPRRLRLRRAPRNDDPLHKKAPQVPPPLRGEGDHAKHGGGGMGPAKTHAELTGALRGTQQAPVLPPPARFARHLPRTAGEEPHSAQPG